LSGDDVLGHGLEVEETGLGDGGFWDDASWWALVDDFGSWGLLDGLWKNWEGLMLRISEIEDGSSRQKHAYTWKAGAWKAFEKGSTYPAEVGSEQRKCLESLRVCASDVA
jgi:hypothetical protein